MDRELWTLTCVNLATVFVCSHKDVIELTVNELGPHVLAVKDYTYLNKMSHENIFLTLSPNQGR